MDTYSMIVVFYIICGSVDLGITECQQNWIEAVGNCFYISNDKLKYAQAKQQCVSFGGDIASFTEDQFEVIKGNIGTGDHWIGLKCSADCDQVTNWHWHDGIATGNWVESNWVTGEPDLGELYSRVTDTGRWAGLYSSFDTGYICKTELNNAVRSSTTTTSTPTTSTITTTTTTSASSEGNNVHSTTLSHSPNKDHTTTMDTYILTQNTILETNMGFGDGSSGNEKEQNTVSDEHLGLWIGMGCACVIGVVALILGVMFYLKAKKKRRPRDIPSVIYTTPDLIPPRSPPPAYLPPEYMSNAVAPLDPLRDCIHRNGPQVNIIKVHPELNEYDKL